MQTETVHPATGLAEQRMSHPRSPDSRPLIFLHIPKTAGTTLERILARQYGHDALFKMRPEEEDLEGAVQRLRDLDAATRRKVRLIHGHMHFGIHDVLGEPVPYMTMLRHPVDRVISHYYYVKRRPNHYLHDLVRDGMTLREYVETAGGGRSIEFDNGQTRAYAGPPYDRAEVGTCDEEMLEAARRNLDTHFRAVGVSERFDESLLLFRHAFGWRLPFYVRHNVTRNRPSMDEVDPETRAVVEEHSRLDLALYRYATDRLDARVRELGVSFQAELAAFRTLNTLYNRARAVRHRLRNIRPGAA